MHIKTQGMGSNRLSEHSINYWVRWDTFSQFCNWLLNSIIAAALNKVLLSINLQQKHGINL